MTENKARKKAVRAEMAASGEPYSRAARAVDGPKKRGELEPVELPSTVALMLARQVYAAWNHLGAVRHLTKDYEVLPQKKTGYVTYEATGPVAEAMKAAGDELWELRLWAEKTAHASGAIPVVPGGLDRKGTPGWAAEQVLYPGASEGDEWCREPGGTMPKPGETRTGKYSEAKLNARIEAQANLLGPVPAKEYSARAHGLSVQPAFPAVEGTPAAPVWDAYLALERFGGQHWERPGDTPADLAATLDGLNAVADYLDGAVCGVLAEIRRRMAMGSLDGVDAEKFEAAAEPILRRRWNDEAEEQHETEPNNMGRFRMAIAEARRAMSDAKAVLPKPYGQQVPPSLERLARATDGAGLPRVRDELASERHMNKQIDKVTAADDTRAQGLERLAQWMHAAGVSVYDAQRHMDAERGVQE